MALPVTFATLSGGNQPLALLDTQFAAVASLGSIPCAAAGQNTIALTPFSGTPTVSSYPDLAPSFVFAAAQTSNGSVQINAALVGARNAYKWNGQQQCGSGDIVAGMVYRATPLQALNSGAGGFVLDSSGVGPAGTDAIGAFNEVDIEFIIDGGGVPITTGNKGWFRIPYSMTMSAWRLLADQPGSIVIDILRAASIALPTVSMVGAGNKPTLASQQLLEAFVTGWTSTAFAPGNWIAFNVVSASAVTKVTIVLTAYKL